MWRRWAAALLVAGTVAGSAIVVVSPLISGGGGAFTCDSETGVLDATTATFASQVTAATAGQKVRLTQGASYGTFAGTNKAITICVADGINPTMALNFSTGDTGFVIDGGRATWSDSTGLTITSGNFSNQPSDITIRDAWISGGVDVDGPINANITFDHIVQQGLDGDNTIGFHFSYGGHSGFLFTRSLWQNMSADAIQTGAKVTVTDSEFFNVSPSSGPGCSGDCHTDAIQFLSGDDSVVTGNFVHGECEQGIGGFDGVTGVTISHNVIVGCTAHSLVTGGSFTGSDAANTIEFNTVDNGTGAEINCSAKATNAFGQAMLGTRVNIRNNISEDGIALSGAVNCTPLQSLNNMLGSGASGSNFNGTPTYVGGATPTTFAGYCLASGSPGKTGASDGTEVGACGGGFTGGPPGS